MRSSAPTDSLAPSADGDGARKAFDQLPEPQWTLDAGGAHATFNRHWRDRIDAHASNWLEPIDAQDRARIDALWQDAQARGIPMRARARLRAGDGNVGWHLLSLSPLRARDNPQVAGWCGLCIGIDDATAGAASATTEDARRFLSELRHELRNRLAALTMAAQVLQHEGASAQMRTRAQLTLQRQAQAMAERIDELLARLHDS